MGKGIFDRPIAHRGLHNREAGIIENTRSAFEAAYQAGFAVECDVQLTRDGVPVIFHDDGMERLLGIEGDIRDAQSDVVLGAPLLGSAAQDRPQTFGQFLEQANGRTLLQVELKQQRPEKTQQLANVVVDIASRYKGPICFESFDPRLLIALRRAGCRGPLGIITERYVATGPDYASLTQSDRIALRHLLHWPVTRFDFLSVAKDALDLPAVRLFRALGKPVTSWTIRSPQEETAARRAADQIVFEGFSPQSA
ncbi:MAG TPA: glycerophosphodiester phosphodiesterase family protein [Devosia sp.]|nr:glycerophosphodiester phosphodiesterase family protein [Devosia sp.]